MRTQLSVVSVIAVILGVASAKLFLDLRHERQVNQDVRTQLIAAKAMARVPVAAPVVVAAPLPVIAKVPPTPAAPACKPATDPAVAASLAEQNRARQSLTVTVRDLLKDPEYRKARIAQLRLDMQRSNPGLAEAMGMSDKEADRFLDLLVDNQIRMNELPSIDAGSPQLTAAENSRRQQELRKQQEESVSALLGPGGYVQWQDYQRTRGARNEAVSIASQLLQSGLPLSSAQLKPLTAALVAERQRQNQDLVNVVRPPGPMDAQAQLQQQEENQRRAAESNRRLLAAMAPSLNAQQLAVFREQFETQTAMDQASIRARQRILASQGQLPVQ